MHLPTVFCIVFQGKPSLLYFLFFLTLLSFFFLFFFFFPTYIFFFCLCHRFQKTLFCLLKDRCNTAEAVYLYTFSIFMLWLIFFFFFSACAIVFRKRQAFPKNKYKSVKHFERNLNCPLLTENKNVKYH